jgi:hypothetical protein
MARTLPIDLSLPWGGRLAIASGTHDPKLRDAYAASIAAVLGRDEGADLVRRLRLTKRKAGALTPAAVHVAVTSYNLASLFVGVTPQEPARGGVRPVMLGETINRFLQKIASDNAEETARNYGVICGLMEAAFGVERDADERIVRDVPVGSITKEQGEDWLKGPKETTGGKPWGAQRQGTAHAVAMQLWAIARAQEEDEATRTGAEWRPWRNFWSHDRHRPTVRPARKRKTRHGFLTRDQAARLLWETRGTRYAAWASTGAYGSLRRDTSAPMWTWTSSVWSSTSSHGKATTRGAPRATTACGRCR